MSSSERKGITRRRLLQTGAVAGAAAATGGLVRPGPARAAPPAVADDLILHNGRIHTMDARSRVVSVVGVSDGEFVYAGDSLGEARREFVDAPATFDLRGRTVVPGVIDSHDHIVLVGNRPGYHTPAEDVTSLQELLDRYAARRRDVPPGQFITTIGPLSTMQLTPDRRLPTLAELDRAVPDRPVYIHPAIHPPSGSATNSLGKAFFESAPLPVTVGADGSIAANEAGQGRALLALRQTFLTPDSRKRTAMETLQYYAAFGITTHLDQGAFQASNTSSDGVAHEDNFTMHEPFLALHADGTLPARLRINFLYMDQDPNSPALSARLRNAYQFFGDDLVKTGSIGEFVAPDPTPPITSTGFPPTANNDNNTRWLYAAMKVAQAGWRAEVHSLSPTDYQAEIDGFVLVNQQFPITDKRWVVAHVPFITADYVERLKTVGAGLKIWGGPIHTVDSPRIPPVRTILNSGIRVGYHSDGGDFELIDPWPNFYTLTTGRNLQGDVLVDASQRVSRHEALWLATAANKWFLGEDDLGSIEVGNHGDLAVLSDDYFSVPDDALKQLRSVLTVVGGRIVHDTGEVTGVKGGAGT